MRLDMIERLSKAAARVVLPVSVIALVWRYVGVILPATYDPSGDVLATISWLYIIYALVRVHSNDQTDRGHLRLVLLCSVASYISTRVVCAWVSPVLRADLTEPVPFWVCGIPTVVGAIILAMTVYDPAIEANVWNRKVERPFRSAHALRGIYADLRPLSNTAPTPVTVTKNVVRALACIPLVLATVANGHPWGVDISFRPLFFVSGVSALLVLFLTLIITKRSSDATPVLRQDGFWPRWRYCDDFGYDEECIDLTAPVGYSVSSLCVYDTYALCIAIAGFSTGILTLWASYPLIESYVHLEIFGGYATAIVLSATFVPQVRKYLWSEEVVTGPSPAEPGVWTGGLSERTPLRAFEV